MSEVDTRPEISDEGSEIRKSRFDETKSVLLDPDVMEGQERLDNAQNSLRDELEALKSQRRAHMDKRTRRASRRSEERARR